MEVLKLLSNKISVDGYGKPLKNGSMMDGI